MPEVRVEWERVRPFPIQFRKGGGRRDILKLAIRSRQTYRPSKKVGFEELSLLKKFLVILVDFYASFYDLIATRIRFLNGTFLVADREPQPLN